MNTSPITLIGNVTQNPELEYTNTGAAKLRFSVACNRSFKRNDEWVEETSFFNVTCWRFLAEDTADIIEKGLGVIVAGRLEQRSWDNPEGVKQYITEVIADNVAVQTRSIENFERKSGRAQSSSTPKASSPRQAPVVSTEDPF
jgi:single-strand DNA-binding protein